VELQKDFAWTWENKSNTFIKRWTNSLWFRLSLT